jgi:ABC-2 type transport system ATP-binding protein
MMANKNIAINVESVNKTFKLPHEKQTSIKGLFVNMFRSRRTYERQQVLKGVSFEIKKGEFFGIVGRNGSGKSTLLKILAGIYSPDKGTVTVNGKLTPFIELGVGFNPELTGRENIFLNGAMLGFNREEIKGMYESIVEFAELEKFMDQKLKNFSSGMQVRLAFSIAIRANSDILLLDEVLAVGDINFQSKCFEYFKQLKSNKKTVIFVSHDMEAVRKYCTKAVYLDRGEIVHYGDAQDVIDQYLSAMAEASLDQKTPLGLDKASVDRKVANIRSVEIVSHDPSKPFLEDSLRVTLSVDFNAPCNEPVPGIIIRNQGGSLVTASNSKWVNASTGSFRRGEAAVFEFHLPNIYESGIYFVSANIVSKDLDTFYDWKNDRIKLLIKRPFQTGGIAYSPYGFRRIDEAR